eukprot:PRCOL_00001761-RA
MGCISSKSVGGGGKGGGGSSLFGRSGYKAPNHEQRVSKWKATGMVVMRAEGLKGAAPEEIASIGQSAKTLDLSGNKLTSVEAAAKLPSLTRLVLSDNLLQALPNEFGALQQLKAMLVDGNRLSSLPPLRTPRLRELRVARNALVSLPAFDACFALQKLDVSKNTLRKLPASLGACEALEEVDASDNLLTATPDSLGNLKKVGVPRLVRSSARARAQSARCAHCPSHVLELTPIPSRSPTYPLRRARSRVQLKVLKLDNNGVGAAGVSPAVLEGCVQLHTLSLHGNPVRLNELEEITGWAAMEARRMARVQKQIDAGTLIARDGLDDGVDRR